MRPVRLDGPNRGRGTTLAWCEDCAAWREIAADRPAALQAAAKHLAQVHGKAKAAAELRERARRHAAREGIPAKRGNTGPGLSP